MFLFKEFKKILNNNNIFANEIFKKKFEYNIKSQLKNNFTFLLKIKSIYLEFIEINPKDNYSLGNNHKVYFPFYYIPLFYTLDFISFKCFISEIIEYNTNSNKFELNLDKENQILEKYINNGEIHYNNFSKIKEKTNSKIFNDITYNLDENNFNVNYDWCIYKKNTKSNKNKGDENKIYKMKIYLPSIKFSCKDIKITITKIINKNLIVQLIKKNFVNWNKYILFDLFILKKFRLIIRNILSHKYSIYSNKKINLEESYINNKNFINEKNYEFFITNINSKKNDYFYLAPNTLIITYFHNSKDIKSNFMQLSLKDTYNIKILSKYLEIYDIIRRCISVVKDTKEIKLNMNLIDNISNDFIDIVKEENLINHVKIKNYDEKEIYNYKMNNIEMNVILRKPKIIDINYDENEIILSYYDPPEILLNDILRNLNINKEYSKSIYNSMNDIMYEVENFEENKFIDFNLEVINLSFGEIISRKHYGKILYEININGGNCLFFGKFKNLKMSKIQKFTSHRNVKKFNDNNIFENNKIKKNNLLKFGLSMKSSPIHVYS